VSRAGLGSTYRLQLHGLGLVGAAGVVPYLDDLGIETVYLSPILAAVPGSTHGYDVVDPTCLDPALGSDDDLEALLDTLASRGMRALLDIVPNHMAVDPANAWWWDVLARGQESPEACIFDIDWSRHDGAVVVPTLGRPLAEAMADGTCVLEHERLLVDGQPFPLAAGTSDRSPARTLARQHYRPTYWRAGETEGNYRRFFDIGSLIGVRVEDPDVFSRTHRRLVAISEHPAVAGVRVDHIDGLADPRAYLARLRDALDRRGTAKVVVVEKILAHDESLDPRWPVEGTTGYEFGNRVLGLFLDPDGSALLLGFGARWVGATDPTFAALAEQAKREVLDRSFSGDLDRLTRRTLDALDLDTPGHDLSFRDVRRAWVEMTVHLGVYRSYLEGDEPSASDQARLAAALERVARQGALGSEACRALDRIAGVLLGSLSAESPWFEVARRWQQLSGAVMAKGSEDTATYRWPGVPVQADVGGDPDVVQGAPEAFHRVAASRAGSLNATSTHDSKRNEDARCRLAVLSEGAGEWAALVSSWHQVSATECRIVMPRPLEELSTYHSLFAVWPTTSESPEANTLARVRGYVLKAAREAKQHTSWTDPDAAYEEVVTSFVDAVARRPDFRQSMTHWCRATAPAALSNLLGLVVLKTWAPGVPDFYQGTELVEPALTDPDNRRPVDFATRAALLSSLTEPSPETAGALLSSGPDGHLKCLVTRALLLERRRQRGLFGSGSYEALDVTTAHAVAYLRRWEDRVALAVVPRLTYGLVGPGRYPTGADVWGDDRIVLPPGAPRRYRDVLTRRMLLTGPDGHLRLGEVLGVLPVAALVADS
jgi:(1->4)-alpha-D-glucan 1-alpha-D-glucosylmutase